MIVQVRGTSGSGKSTVMRGLMTIMGNWTPRSEPGRKKPLFYDHSPAPSWLDTVISGGQSGADVAGLKAAKASGLNTGGFMPKGYRTLDGNRPAYAATYGVQALSSPDYPERTLANVCQSDGTVRFARVWDSPGEKCTLRALRQSGKPWMDVHLGKTTPAEVTAWIEDHGIRVLNVAGNSEQTAPGIESEVYDFLMEVFSRGMHLGFPAVVLGHYESPCGGCDTIGSAPAVFDLISKFPPETHVLCEGLLLSEDSKWTRTLAETRDVRCVFLTTPLDRCLAQIEKRRADAGNEKPLNPANTSNRVAVIERARRKLVESGVYCRRAAPEQAPGMILQWLRTAGEA